MEAADQWRPAEEAREVIALAPALAADASGPKFHADAVSVSLYLSPSLPLSLYIYIQIYIRI